jgi:mannosyltransferase
MPKKIQKKELSNLWLIPILITGLFFRIYNNSALAMWHDEAFSALLIRDYSWKEMMRRIALDVHPPLYYWILRLWSYVFGTGMLSLRGFSILFGTLTIWAAYLFVKKAFGSQRLALLASLLIAINPFQAQYALEARMYTFGTFLLLLSSYWLLKALETQKFKDWTIYGLLVAGCFYTHYYLIFSIAAQGLYVIYWLFKNKKFKIKAREFWYSMWSYFLVALTILPWLPTFLIQRSRVEKQYWIPAMDRWSIPGTIWKMIFGGQGIRHMILIIATLVSVILIYFFISRFKNQSKWLLVLSLFFPFLASILLSLQTAIYLDRYFVFASLFFTILIAAVVDLIHRPQARKIIATILVAMLVFAFFKNWYDMDIKNMFLNRSLNKKPGMAAASAIINEYARPQDKIYVGSSFVYFTFRYYNQTGIKPRLTSSGTLDTIPHFSGTALLSPEDLILEHTIFEEPEVKKDDTVWLVWTTGFGGSKPNVPGNWSKAAEYSYADAPGFKGDIYVTQYHVN